MLNAIEQFSTECRKTRNQSNYAGQSQRTQSNPLSNQNSKQLHEARENLCEQVTIGFGFTSDWLRKWREFLKPISRRSNAKPNANHFQHSSENCSRRVPEVNSQLRRIFSFITKDTLYEY